MFKNIFLKTKKLCIICSLILSFVFLKVSNAKEIKILATVNSIAITDYDVEEFGKIMCFLSKKPFKDCQSQETMQMALMSVIETTLKDVHMQKMNIKDEAIDKKHFNEYKKSILEDRKISKEIDKDFFNKYFKTEYLWQMIIMSQAQTTKITDDELKSFAKMQNQTLTDKNKDRFYSMIIQQRANQINLDYMDRLKKFYLVDIKI